MTGGRDIFVKEVLGGAYDSQAEHFLRGDVGVDSAAIAHETMLVNGKVRMYFGPFPALLRIPFNFVCPPGHGKWSRISGFCAGVIALFAFAGLVQTMLRSSPLSSGARNWIGNACVIGFALGSPLLLLLGNLSIYDEAIIWGLAWSIAALYFACRSRSTEGTALTRSLLGFSFCAGAALLSRATFGAPFLLIAPLLAIRLFRRQPIRNITALFLPLGAAFMFHLFLSYARFGDFSGMNMRYNINPVQREFAVKHGLFRIERVPYSFADYFFLRLPKPQRQAPFLKANRQDYHHASLYVMPFTETYSSVLWSSSWILLGAVIGVAMLLRPGGADGVDRAGEVLENHFAGGMVVERASGAGMFLEPGHRRGAVVEDENHVASRRRVVYHLHQAGDAAVDERAVANHTHHALRLLRRHSRTWFHAEADGGDGPPPRPLWGMRARFGRQF